MFQQWQAGNMICKFNCLGLLKEPTLLLLTSAWCFHNWWDMRKDFFSSDINDKLNDTLDFNLAYLMLFFTLEASSGSLRYIIAPFFLPPNDYKAIIDWINSSSAPPGCLCFAVASSYNNHLVFCQFLPKSPLPLSELILPCLLLYYLVLLKRNNCSWLWAGL